MKGLAFGGAYWVVDIEATSLMTGSKEFVVVIKSSISTILLTTTQASLKVLGLDKVVMMSYLVKTFVYDSLRSLLYTLGSLYLLQ
jgi:hypothetical protein